MLNLPTCLAVLCVASSYPSQFLFLLPFPFFLFLASLIFLFPNSLLFVLVLYHQFPPLVFFSFLLFFFFLICLLLFLLLLLFLVSFHILFILSTIHSHLCPSSYLPFFAFSSSFFILPLGIVFPLCRCLLFFSCSNFSNFFGFSLCCSSSSAQSLLYSLLPLFYSSSCSSCCSSSFVSSLLFFLHSVVLASRLRPRSCHVTSSSSFPLPYLPDSPLFFPGDVSEFNVVICLCVKTLHILGWW